MVSQLGGAKAAARCELTVAVDGVLGAGRGGGLGAVTTGTVQRVPAAPRGV